MRGVERREARAFESDCSSEERGAFAERISDVFSESRASSLVEGFGNSAPAWPPKRTPAAPSVLSVSSVVKFLFLALDSGLWTLDARHGLRPIIHLPDLEIRVLLPANLVPPAIHIMRERPRPHLPEAVELGDFFNSNDYITHFLT